MTSSGKTLFTSESVSAGHPDKICDQISDAIVDYLISNDSNARAAIETVVSTNRLFLLGEYRTEAKFDLEEIEQLTRNVVQRIGYDQLGFSYKTFRFASYLNRQSPDIAQGVDIGGAGDQGIMFGYACDETPSGMPATISYAHLVLQKLAQYADQNPSAGLLPDAKSQVTLSYVDGYPVDLKTLVISSQHQEGVSLSEVEEHVHRAIEGAFPKQWLTAHTEYYINPTGKFVIGGPNGDAGLTGRKIIVDTYGGAAPHGGGCFSGKDATKVDRSAAYAARHIANTVVQAGLAHRCLIQLSYAIGKPEPLSIHVNTSGTGHVSDATLVRVIENDFLDLTPQGIIDHLQLKRPIFSPTAVFGHFGRPSSKEGHFSWERLSLVEELQRKVATAA